MYAKASASVSALPLTAVLGGLDNSLKRVLRADPHSDERKPNQEPREVFGQWVEVDPTPLPEPYLVAIAPAMAAELDLDVAACATDPLFPRVFAGDVDALPSSAQLTPWATPYAVSVFGQPIPSPDPFGRGNAYGDGRALSLGEFVVERTSARWELQLKGSGTTPFSRGGDGRAVLRSSIREFLVSEAMHAMGVPTTRALCLVASGSQYTRRMWYKEDDKTRHDHPPDHMVVERCAITCRAAPSFVRVGHLELWSRRAARGVDGAAAELRALVDHAIGREFSEQIDGALPERERLLALVRAFAERQAELAISWLRVGYVQGNMNSDNCLLSGRTMDYGPFGFLERYEPLWSPFTSDMERKFGFERQPLAAQVNLMTLAKALMPLFERLDDYDGSLEQLQTIVQDEYKEIMEAKLGEMRRAKLGLERWDAAADAELWPELQALLTKSGCDYTIFFRELARVKHADAAHVVETGTAAAAGGGGDSASSEAAAAATAPMLACLTPSFYDGVPTGATADEWAAWMVKYASRLASDARDDAARLAEMHATSPKYIPREWILAEAYTKAEVGDLTVVHELLELFATPFDEQTEELAAKYYRRAPSGVEKKAGIGYFS